MEAVRWFEAARAAAEGSRELESCRRDSWTLVGERLLGLLLLRKRRFVENLRERLEDFGSGKSSGVGSGSDRFLRSLIMGRTSSRSLRFSSAMRISSSRRRRISASRSLMMWMMRAMSSCVGCESCVSASAAGWC